MPLTSHISKKSRDSDWNTEGQRVNEKKKKKKLPKALKINHKGLYSSRGKEIQKGRGIGDVQ